MQNGGRHNGRYMEVDQGRSKDDQYDMTEVSVAKILNGDDDKDVDNSTTLMLISYEQFRKLQNDLWHTLMEKRMERHEQR